MEVNKKIQVHMLPTEDRSHIVKRESDSKIIFYNRLQSNKEFVHLRTQHLYFTSDEKPELGDLCVYLGTDIMKHDHSEVWNKDKCKKIIATTDITLSFTNVIKNHLPSLPQPSQAFIEAFCKAGGIWKVLVEYTDWCEYDDDDPTGIDRPDLRLKVNSNNEIIIHQIKDSWTREEVEVLCRQAMLIYKADNTGYPGLITSSKLSENRWIEENL